MNHFQKLRKSSMLEWVSSYFVENRSKPLRKVGLFVQRQNPRLYMTKRVVATESSESTMMPRIPGTILKEAEAALLDYLHSTRGILFADAENMSKNSPFFLQKLLKKFDIEKDVGSAMSRFLRYHPINEFEPFFESVGLKPCEYAHLLPKYLMFLSDDSLLMENYRVLCECGIERKNIGKIYKEAIQVFHYNFGVLPLKLQAYRELGLAKSFMAKVIVCSPRVLICDVDMKLVRVLDVLRSLGFDYAWIEEHLCEQDSYNWSMILRVLNFFSAMCCSSELHGLFSRHPGILFEDSGIKLLSLIAFLLKFGSTTDHISTNLLQFPEIQVSKFLSNFIRCFLHFNEIEMELNEIGKIVCSYPLLLGSIVLKKPNSLFNYLNVGKRRLCKYIQENPHELSKLAIGAKVMPLPYSEEDIISQRLRVKFLLDLGYSENPDLMKKALKIFRGRGSDLQERFDSIVNAGLDKKDVSKMVKVSPQILNQTKETIQTKINVLVNELGYPVSTLVMFPSYLAYTAQRVRLRLAMYNWLVDHAKANPDLALSTIVSCTDTVFVRQYVNHHPSGPQVWETFKRKFVPG